MGRRGEGANRGGGGQTGDPTLSSSLSILFVANSERFQTGNSIDIAYNKSKLTACFLNTRDVAGLNISETIERSMIYKVYVQ